MADREILESTGWLNDRIVNASQKMLQLQAKHIKGWQSTLCRQNPKKIEVIDLWYLLSAENELAGKLQSS